MSKRIENLINSKDTVNAQALKAALARREEEKAQEQAESVLRVLKSIDDDLQAEVTNIRETRKLEKAIKDHITALDNLSQKLAKDGNVEEANQKLRDLRNQHRKSLRSIFNPFSSSGRL